MSLRPEKEDMSIDYKMLYNIHDSDLEIIDDAVVAARYKNFQVLQDGTDPRAILDHFKEQGKVNRDEFLRLDDDLAQAPILPEAFKAIEERAISAAQKGYRKQV
jgi:hypothetical protein